jgi:predicted DNA-binding transcriptional regulator YafY
MYQPTSRLLTVLELLQARPMISGTELARRLEVDGRTVRRYVVTLQDLGIPVEAVHGRYGGYRLRPGYKLPPLMFTEDEALAVTLGLLAARQLGLDATAPAIEGALAKLERVLPDPVSVRVRALEETINLTAIEAPQATSGHVLLTLSTAAYQQRRVWMRYVNAEDVESEREFDPYGLVFSYGRWFVVGPDHRSGEMRTFRIDRVLEVAPREATFERPAGFDPVEYLATAIARMPLGIEVEVLLETSIEQATAWIPRHRAELETVEGGVLMRFQADGPAMAARFLAWIEVPFVVLSPDIVRDELRRLAAELVDVAERRVPAGG